MSCPQKRATRPARRIVLLLLSSRRWKTFIFCTGLSSSRTSASDVARHFSNCNTGRLALVMRFRYQSADNVSTMRLVIRIEAVLDTPCGVLPLEQLTREVLIKCWSRMHAVGPHVQPKLNCQRWDLQADFCIHVKRPEVLL